MRRIHIFTIFIVILHLITPPSTQASTPVSSGLEEQLIELVNEGTPAQPIDFTSRTLDPITPATPFDAILFNWIVVGNANDIQLRARFLTDNRWSDWRNIVHNPEFAPENAPRNQYTSTLFDLNAVHTAWQIAVVIRPDAQSYLKSIRTITMNNQGANPRRLQLPSAASKLPRGSKPPIVPRSTWGDATLANWDTNAAPWSGYCSSTSNTRTWQPDPSEIAPATHVVIHHTAGTNYVDPSSNNWPASVLGIWRYHAMTLGWCDIGYHYLIDPNGVIYEGRYTGVRDDGTVADGAHALGHNRATIGISLMGNFETAEPSASAIQALDNLLSWIGSSKNIPFNTEQYYAYKNKMLNTIVGHRDVGSTACPGNFLYAKLPEIRLRAAQNTYKPSDDQWLRGVSADRTSVVAGEVVTFRMTVQNIYQTIPISGSAFAFGTADAEFTYDQEQCWAVKDDSGQSRFPRPANITSDANNRFRVIAGISGWDSANANTMSSCPVASTIDHPWRWSIGTSILAAGATRTITGRVRFTQPGTYSVYFGLIKDWVGYPDTPCDRRNNQGACQLHPIKITVIKPTPTYAPYVRTQVSISTATHAQIRTMVAATQTSVAIDRNNATREVLRGSPTRTPTPRGPTTTPVPAMQSVIALRTATQEMRVMQTMTAAAMQTAAVYAQQQTQTVIAATQVVDGLTATAELETRTPTNSATATLTRTQTRTPTNTATRTRTNQPTQTHTHTPIPSRLFDPNTVTSNRFRGKMSQMFSDGTTLWALKPSNPPVLLALDPSTLAQRSSTTIQGINATLMSVNQHNTNELFVVGRYAWDLLAVQRFNLQSGVPRRTGVWLYKTMGTPSALISTGRYVYLTINHASTGTMAASAELITLRNANPFTEAFARSQIAGAITSLTNIDSGDLTVLAAGRNLDKTGFVVPIHAGQRINRTLRITLPKPLQSLSPQIQTQGLIPAMLIIGSDGSNWTHLTYTITTRKLERLHVQSNLSLMPNLISSQPFISLAITTNRLGFDVFYLYQNRYQYRATINISSISLPIQRYINYQNLLYWHDGVKFYRAVITLP